MYEAKKAKESADLHQQGTIEVTEFETKIGQVSVKVWDSPGLQDGTENQADYLAQMKEKCSERDLTLYCIKATETRIVRGTDNPDVVAMVKLTKTFTVNFWKNSIIVLTFANQLQYNSEILYMKGPPEKKVEAQKKILQEWDKQLRIILSEDIKIPEEIVEKIKIVPAGYYGETHLPVHEYWLSNLWGKCLDTIETKEAKEALVILNATRLKKEKEVKKEDFQQPPEKQPIAVKPWGSSITLDSLSEAVTAGAVVAEIIKNNEVPYTEEVRAAFVSLATVVGFMSSYYEER